MSDRDDFAELITSARNVTKSSSFYFTGRIRYGTKNEKVEERFLCMDNSRVYICTIKIPVKIESQFNILSIKVIERLTDFHINIETEEKQSFSLYGLNDKASLQPFLIVLVGTLRTIFPRRLQTIVEFRPENEYDKLIRLSNEYLEVTSSDIRPCAGFSIRYKCVCDFYETQCYPAVQNLIDTVYSHRQSRDFTFREFDSLEQKNWLPIIAALRHNEWFKKITIENTKLSSENIDELCTVIRLNRSLKDVQLINCGFRPEFGTRFATCLCATHAENVDLSNNAIEDKGLIALSSLLQQRKLPFRSLNFQSCSITYKGLSVFNTALISNNIILKNLQILNLSGNRIKEESCITNLFSNSENILEELHLSDIEFSIESFFYSLATLSCKLRRLFISSIKSTSTSSITGGVKLFFAKNQTLEILQLSNANLSADFLRELCDGLHSNINLNKLDLRLSGNQLESFIHENASRFATIPCLIALDLTGCDLDNEIPTFLAELKKNRKLKTLHLGKNFNNIKTRYMQKTINAMKELLLESNLEYLSIADSKLKENIVDFLLSLTNNTSLKTLDIRGNVMGDTGVRALTHLLQTNRQLQTIFFDRNVLSLNNFEDIVNAMEENHVIQYLPIPITDIILMKTTEKDRMEKLQNLINKLDSLCARNQEQKENVLSTDSLIVTTTANLTREITQSWENQRQLFGDQTSLEYILSCSNRTNNKTEEIQSVLTRTARINKASSQLYELYINEEESIKNEWNEMCKKFEQKLKERNERLSKKSYQLFKEQTSINYDDKFHELFRTYFSNTNDNISHLLNKEIPARLVTYTRECYTNVSTCLQKRAYDTMNDIAIEMHKQLETTMSHAATSITDVQQSSSTSTIDRIVNRSAQVVHRLAHKHGHTQADTNDEPTSNRQLPQTDSNENLTDPLPKSTKENRLSTIALNKNPTPPKPPLSTNLRRSVLGSPTEQESVLSTYDSHYNNVLMRNLKEFDEIPNENEGDLIEHDLLDLVEQEQMKDQQKHSPPALPAKKRVTSTIVDVNLDFAVEPTEKLIHPGKDRPRRTQVRRPVKRSTNGASHESSSDGGLDNDDENSTSQIPSTPEPSNVFPVEPPPTSTTPDQPLKAAKPFKPMFRNPKTTNDETTPPPVPVKTQQQISRLSVIQQQINTPSTTTPMSKSVVLTNSESPLMVNTEPIQDNAQSKQSLPISTRDEYKETGNPFENPTSPAPPVLARTGKAAIGTRVFPELGPNGEAPPIKLRHFQADKKASTPLNTPSTENPIGSEITSAAGDSQTVAEHEQYKRLSVKERARMLTTTIPPTDKKSATSPSSTTGVLNDK